MNDVQIYSNPEFGEVRTIIGKDGEPLFCGLDVAKALGYSRTADAISAHCKGVCVLPTPTSGGVQQMKFIPEPDVYRLIFGSKLPGAEKFTDWVTEEVIPAIRKTGSYSTPAVHSRRSDRELEAADKRAAAMLLNAKSRVADKLQKLYDRAGVKAEYQAQALSGFYATDGIDLPRIALQGTKVTYDKGTIAKKLGILSNHGNPHAQAVGAIISQLDIKPDEVEAVPFQRNGHDGTDYQYTDSVVTKVRLWLERHNYPSEITYSGKAYKVVYRGN